MTSIAHFIKTSEYVCTGRYSVQASAMFLNELIISLNLFLSISLNLFLSISFSQSLSISFSQSLSLSLSLSAHLCMMDWRIEAKGVIPMPVPTRTACSAL